MTPLRWTRTPPTEAGYRTRFYTDADYAAIFWSRVQQGDGCWEWTGKKTPKGYGCLSVRGGTTRANRFAWEITNGKIPDGLVVCHKCDNPGCVRPDHLWIGTHADNIRDRDAKGRQRVGRNPHTKIEDADLPAVAEMLHGGMTRRQIAAKLGISYNTLKSAVRCRIAPPEEGS